LVTFPGSGNPIYADAITVYFDGIAPYTHIIDPHDGSVFTFGVTIPITGLANDTAPEAAAMPGIKSVRFQYKDGRAYWVGTGYYNHGIDPVFIDMNGNGTFQTGIDIVRFGNPGEGATGNLWFDIDPTPMDNTDDPIIINFGDPNEDTYTIDFDTRQMWSTEDSYVHLRMLATDTAGNETVKDPLHAEEIVIILDDATAPVAYLQWLNTSCAPTCRYLCGPEIEAFRGTVTLYGKVLDPTHWDLSRVVAVDIEIRPEGTPDWTVLGRDQTPFLEEVPAGLGCTGDITTGQFFTYTWDTEDPWPQGVYELRAVAIDDDGNSFPDDALIVKVRIDRTPPVVYYEGTGFPGFVESLEQYYDDGTPGTSPVIKRDPDTGDVEFFVFTPDDDIRTITLQWRYPTDPIGMWRPWSDAFNGFRGTDPNTPGYRRLFSDFQYEPALNFGTNRVWTAHADDFFYETTPGAMDNLVKRSLIEGPIEWRVLATDLACNTNAAVEDFVTAAVDLTCPTVCDYSVDKPTRRVVPGETMNFRVCVQDAVTDVRHVTIQAVVDAGLPTEKIYVVRDGDLLPVVEGTNVFDLDGYNTQWWFEAAWAFPDVVYKDTKLDIYIVRTDPAGNMCRSDVDDIYVQDLVPPDRTKIVVIANRTTYTDDPNDGVVINGQDLNRLQDNDNIWVNRDASELYDPFNGNPANLDYLISEGALHGVENNEANSMRYFLGDTEATYPRWVDEGYMGNSAANPARLARTVTLVGRTWVDDQSFGGKDDGVAKVTFLVKPVGGTAVVLGKDEYQPFYPLYLWHVVWNTREVATDGVTPLWPDGNYEIAAYGEDLSHNVEDVNSLEWTRVTVDNTAPKTQMDADLNAAGFQDRPPTDIERNTMFTLFTVISPENPLNDDAATFYIKRARDLNMPGSWLAIPAVNDPCTLFDENWGWGPEDGNPDDTRPYSFDLNLTKAMDPVEFLHWLNDPNSAPQPGPLHVGEEYDFVAAGHDLLNNTFSHIDAFADTSPKRSIRFKVVDTIAPIMTITQAKRNIGDMTVINNPDKIYAQSFEYLQARNLTGDVDLEDVFFVYREQGTTSWTLLDGTLTEYSTGNWRIGPWDVRALKHNTWYEVAAIGVDDVGNQSDPSLPTTRKVLVYVDFTPPDNYAFTRPAAGVVNLCDWYVVPEADNPTWRYYDLTVTDADAIENVDTWKIEYYWKLNSTIDTGLSAWTRIDTESYPVIHDDATNSWWVKWDIHERATELYDIAARVMDVAGNETLIRIDRLGYDADAPTPLAVTNIEAITAGAPEIEFHPGGWTDIAAGIEIRIWASAKDDELALPEDRETAVSTMQFYATVDNGTTWMDLGTITPTPNQGDPTDYAGSVDWNTTGIPVGTQLWVGVIATDECGNATSRVTYRLRITDIVPPTARIIAFDPDLEPHGEYPPTCVKIYALAESDSTIESVIFQYDTIEGPNDLDHEWVNIGVGQKLTDANEPRTTEVLWWTALKTSSLPSGITRYWLRALARDEKGNRYGDKPTDVVPTMMAELETLYDGSITFKPIRTTVPEVEDVSIQVESMTNAILTVKMASAMDHPRVVVLGEPYYVDGTDICLENNYYWIYSADLPANPEWDGDFGLVRSLNDPTVWRGEITLDTTYGGSPIFDCLKFNINVTGTDAGLMIDHASVWINEYPISAALGTNGTVQSDAYGMTDAHKITVVSGAWRGEDVCLLASQTVPPTVDSDQGIYLAPVAKSAYHMQVTKGHNELGNFQDGYHPLVQIKYDQAAVNAALSDGVTEEMLTVRKWGRDCRIDPTGETWKWIGDDISHIHVDPVNNILSFRVGNLDDARERWSHDKSDEFPQSDTTEVDLCYRGNIFQIFAPKSSAPVFVFSVTPFSEYRSGWWTDADPVFTTYLNDVGGQGIDPTTVQVKIDGNLVATFNGTGPAQWYWGNGNAYLWQANAEGTVYEMDYSHSTLQRDWLAERTNPLAPHIFTVEYRTIRGTHELVSVDTPFWVDQTPPTIEFHGGWVSNPLLRNIRGYIAGEGCGPGPMDCMLTVRMTDTGSGIFVRPHRQEYLYDHDGDGWIDPEDMNADPTYECGNCADWIAIDWGIHYDLWRVDGEDEQANIDEFEERELLHQGTADELLPYIQRQVGTAIYDGLAGYNPETDKLLVRLPIVGGGRIADKDIIEVTIYSEKYRTLLGEGPALGCDVIEEIEVNGETMYILSDCWFDFLSQQRIVYTQGVLDQVRNSGSAYVEQRFIVDMTPPTCVINLPGATMTPAERMPLDISVIDDGVGASNSVSVKLTGPVSRDTTLTVVGGRSTATLAKPGGGWPFGEYTVSVTSSDLLGQKCVSMKTVRVENPVLTLTDAHCYPNPFDPADGDVNIHFVLSRTSDVTVKIYDFAGNYVSTVVPGPNGFAWGGTAADGTKLANGAYIVRVTATDGARTEVANLKVVLWRE